MSENIRIDKNYTQLPQNEQIQNKKPEIKTGKWETFKTYTKGFCEGFAEGLKPENNAVVNKMANTGNYWINGFKNSDIASYLSGNFKEGFNKNVNGFKTMFTNSDVSHLLSGDLEGAGQIFAQSDKEWETALGLNIVKAPYKEGYKELKKAVDDGDNTKLSKAERAVGIIGGIGHVADEWTTPSGLAVLPLMGAGIGWLNANAPKALLTGGKYYLYATGASDVVEGVSGNIDAKTITEAEQGTSKTIGGGITMMIGKSLKGKPKVPASKTAKANAVEPQKAEVKPTEAEIQKIKEKEHFKEVFDGIERDNREAAIDFQDRLRIFKRNRKPVEPIKTEPKSEVKPIEVKNTEVKPVEIIEPKAETPYAEAAVTDAKAVVKGAKVETPKAEVKPELKTNAKETPKSGTTESPVKLAEGNTTEIESAKIPKENPNEIAKTENQSVEEEPWIKREREIKKWLETLKDDDGNPRFSDYEIDDISFGFDQYPEFIKNLIEMRTDEGKLRLSGNEVRAIKKITNKANREYILKLLNMKTKDGKSYLFRGYEISSIANSEVYSPWDNEPKIGNSPYSHSSISRFIGPDFSFSSLFESPKIDKVDAVIKLIEQNPDIEPERILLDCKDIKPSLLKYLNEIYSDSNNFQIVNTKDYRFGLVIKNGNQYIGISPKEEFIFGEDKAFNKINAFILKRKDGLHISTPEQYSGNSQYAVLEQNMIKLNTNPENANLQFLCDLTKKTDLEGEKVFSSQSALSNGHANFDLPQGKSTVSKANGTTIMQLDNKAKPNEWSERAVYHYPDGKVSAVDFGTDTLSVLEPNKSGTGMIQRITQKMSDGTDKTINLTSEISEGTIKITNNETGKTLEYPLSKIIEADFTDLQLLEKGDNLESISGRQRDEKILELFRKLSPKTILDIIEFQKVYPDAKFPYLKDSMFSCCGVNEKDGCPNMITLSDDPYTVSHEALHGITFIRKFTEGPLKDIHTKESKNNSGIVSRLSDYATEEVKDDFLSIVGKGKPIYNDRGLHEFLSIWGTARVYGEEMAYRGEPTRLSFPETAKEAAKIHMQNDLDLINELIENQ